MVEIPGDNPHRPACSIVIRAFNEAQHIGRLLEGIAQQTIQEVEIVLVDSGSTDTTVAAAAEHRIAGRSPVKVAHVRPEEFTFGHSLNRGIAAASGDLVVIASAHVYPVYPDWLERLLAPFADPQVVLTYGKQRGNAESKFSEQQVFAHWYPDQSQPRQYHPFCNNANAAIRRSVWEKHPYDETLPGLEDLAWAKWVIEQSYAIAYIAEAEIVHVHAETARGVYNRYRREAMAFKRIFPDEHFHLWDFTRLVITNVISDLWHSARQHARRDRAGLLPQVSSIFWFRLMQFWGTYQGYRQTGPLTWQLRQTFYYPHGIREVTPSARRDLEPIRYKDEKEK